MEPLHQQKWSEIKARLSANAPQADATTEWPADSWRVLCEIGSAGWRIPSEYGGQEWGSFQILEGYERLASACLTSTFILSQHDAACRRIITSPNEALRRELLPALASGERFATVGLSHLSTSRQHLKPSLTMRANGSHWVLHGTIPWVTGASQAEHIVIGAVLEDGRQALAVLPRALPGVHVGQPLELMALRGSVTAEIICEDVKLESRWLLTNPTDQVMTSGGQGGTGGLETSCLGLGLAQSAIDYLDREAVLRPELGAIAERLECTRQALRKRMFEQVLGESNAHSSSLLRASVNSLVLRATQAALTASKGTGFVLHHPAQRWARQALFFLVWSCPRTAADATMAYLSDCAEH